MILIPYLESLVKTVFRTHQYLIIVIPFYKDLQIDFGGKEFKRFRLTVHYQLRHTSLL